ncbi:MAG: hypothetical protein MJA29_11505, partial [Candidatus Omnitrophica bacterium]|nr:hypothetical protein [Candidatus Omnitrophota bacterium]
QADSMRLIVSQFHGRLKFHVGNLQTSVWCDRPEDADWYTPKAASNIAKALTASLAQPVTTQPLENFIHG